MIDTKQPMTFEEVKNFFSATDEYTVEDLSSAENPPPYLRITLTDYYSTHKHKCSTLLSVRIAVQHLIRTIGTLQSNMNAKNYDPIWPIKNS